MKEEARERKEGRKQEKVKEKTTGKDMRESIGKECDWKNKVRNKARSMRGKKEE